MKHVHKYIRVQYGGSKVVKDEQGRRHLQKDPKRYEVFKCAECPSFMPREIVIGRISRCWYCNEELILDHENTKAKKPLHPWCKKVKVA